jgi:hypothetical protein
MVRFRREVDEHRSIHDNETQQRLGPVINTIYIQPENFTKLFNNNIETLLSVHPQALQVLLVAVKYATFSEANGEEGSYFYNDDIFKQRCHDLIKPEIPKNTINKYLHDLAEASILIRKSRGTYLINPYFLLKGKIPKTANFTP